MTKFEEFEKIMYILRSPDGCPWDRAQTHETLKAPCIEEAAEVVCGINILNETGNADNLKEELGDLLMQVVINAHIAEEEGFFTMEDVLDGVMEKLIRRHPHVFDKESEKADGAEEALSKWNAMKAKEKKDKEEINKFLPAAFEESIELIGVAQKRKGYK